VIASALAAIAYAEQVQPRLIATETDKQISHAQENQTPEQIAAGRNVSNYLKKSGCTVALHTDLTIVSVHGHTDGAAAIPSLVESMTQLPRSRGLLISLKDLLPCQTTLRGNKQHPWITSSTPCSVCTAYTPTSRLSTAWLCKTMAGVLTGITSQTNTTNTIMWAPLPTWASWATRPCSVSRGLR